MNFIKQPPKEIPVECPVCYNIFYQPKMVSCCGHSFCAMCVSRITSVHKPCPLCNQQFILADNKWLERTLNGYAVYCPHQEKGCKWKGDLGQLEHHLNRNPQPGKLDGCQFQEIQCGLCWSYQCERQSMNNHESNDCPNRSIACEYHFAGCDVKKPKQELEKHMKDSVSLHLSLISIYMQSNLSLKEKEVCELKIELRNSKDINDGLKKTLKNQNKIMMSVIIAGIVFAILLAFLTISQANRLEINRLLNVSNQDVKALREELKGSLSAQKRASELEISRLLSLREQDVLQLRKDLKESLASQQHANKLEIDRLKKQSDHCEGTVSSQFSNTKCTCPSLPESKLKIIETEVEYLRKQLDYPSLPVFVEFTELKEDESGYRLLSIPFYACASQSCEYKYLLRLVVYPKGTGRGTNSHMSVYIRLMKGKYDNRLSWPFRGVVEVGLWYYTEFQIKTFNFSNASDPEANRRVTDGTMANKGIGYSHFMSHKKMLMGNASLYFMIMLNPTSETPHSLPSGGISSSDIAFWSFIIVSLCACCTCIASAQDRRK